MIPNTMVVDLSHHNEVQVSLAAAREAGVVGVIHKMTEGTGFTDLTADNRKFLADQAGLKFGIYHFLHAGSMKAQADYFLGTAVRAGVLGPDTLVAADFEDPAVSLAQVEEFMVLLEEKTDRSPVLYSGQHLKAKGGGTAQPGLKRFRLWMPQYTKPLDPKKPADLRSPTLPTGFDSYWLWQWTDKGTVPGISPVDCNDYRGTAEQLRAEWAGTSVGGGAGPAELVVRVFAPKGVRVIVEQG